VVSRDQGGTLDLHLESGQAALHAADLFSKFQDYIRSEAQETRIVDKHGKIHIHVKSEDNTIERPEIDRGDLRRLLVDSIEKSAIHWGTRVHDIKPSQENSNKYTVVYNGGDEATFDLVVGADGAWSKVRPLLSSAKPVYSTLSFNEMRILDAETKCPEIFEITGRGSCFIVSDGKMLAAQCNADKTVRVYAAIPIEEDQFPEVNAILSKPVEGRRYLSERYTDWDVRIQDLIHRCEDRIIPRPIYALPVPHIWESKAGLALIGDAAHLMSPFAGAGANMGMWDGKELGLLISEAVKTGTPISEAVAEFEQKMYKMTRPMTELSATNLMALNSENAAAELAIAWNEQMAQMAKYKASREQ
jgi:2-polyprenyl-6-methoxyphenol hydroxylase-like FAD-dependent oxidoreductase